VTTAKIRPAPKNIVSPSALVTLTVSGDRPVSAVATTEPWSRRDVVTFGACTLLGGALLGAGYLGTSAEVLLPEQVPFLDLGIAGLLVGTVGGLTWLRAGFRTVRQRKTAVVTTVHARFVPDALGAGHDTDGLVTAGRMTRYHRAGCSLVAGKPVTTASRADHERAGLEPCGMCTP
jgi:hypothetical protein